VVLGVSGTPFEGLPEQPGTGRMKLLCCCPSLATSLCSRNSCVLPSTVVPIVATRMTQRIC
jgi:hypothetical protein